MANRLTRRGVLTTGVKLTAAVSIPGMFATAPLAKAEEQIESIKWALVQHP